MTFARANNILLASIILLNSFVIVMPIVPFVSFYLPSNNSVKQHLTQKISSQQSDGQIIPTPKTNTLIAPAMLLEQPILEGKNTYATLDQGILRWPASSTPDKGGNTVLLAHRFTYTQPKGSFYYLDKLKVGDAVGVAWRGVMYHYTITETKVVEPNATDILANTDTPRLTLFTCTPLAWPKDRLVVIAEPVKQSGDKP